MSGGVSKKKKANSADFESDMDTDVECFDTDEEDTNKQLTVVCHVGKTNMKQVKGPKIEFSAPIPGSSLFFGCGPR